MHQDYYKILGVFSTASKKEIRASFHRLAKRYHPDRSKDPGTAGKFREACEAYEILSDEAKRKAYDSLISFWKEKIKPYPGTQADRNSVYSFSENEELTREQRVWQDEAKCTSKVYERQSYEEFEKNAGLKGGVWNPEHPDFGCIFYSAIMAFSIISVFACQKIGISQKFGAILAIGFSLLFVAFFQWLCQKSEQ